MLNKICLASIILLCIGATVYGYMNEIKSLMIGFTMFACLIICLWHEQETVKKIILENDKRVLSPASSLEERPHKVIGSWMGNSGMTHTLFLPLVYEDEFWDPKKYQPKIVILNGVIPESLYVEPVLGKNSEILSFLEFPKERIRKTPNGERMIRKPNYGKEEFGG